MKLRGVTCGVVLLLTITASAQNREAPDAPSAAAHRPALTTSFRVSTQAPRASRPVRALPDAPSSTALSTRQKFQVFIHSAGSPLTLASAGVDAAAARARVPYGANWSWNRSYTAALAQRESNEFLGRFLFPALLKQDPRYHPAESDKVMGRAFYAASRVFVTRTDQGKPSTNTSYLLSTLLTSTVANVYRPRWERGVGNTFADVGTTIGTDAGMYILREIWPQLRQTLSNHTPKGLKKLGDKFSGNDESVD